jgi:Amidohydrolase
VIGRFPDPVRQGEDGLGDVVGDGHAHRVVQAAARAGQPSQEVMGATGIGADQHPPPQLELRRTAPGEIAGLHRAAAGWLAGHGDPAEAVRHAQAAQDWALAGRLLAGQWPGLYLDGQAGAIHELVAGFPAGLAAADAGLAVVAAADELARGSLEAAGRYLTLAETGLESLPEAGQGQARLLLAVVRLLLARQRGDLPAVTEYAARLPDMAEHAGSDAVQSGLGEEPSTLGLRRGAAPRPRRQRIQRGRSGKVPGPVRVPGLAAAARRRRRAGRDHVRLRCAARRRVTLETNARGLYLGDPAMEPILDALDQRHALVVLHPTSPPGWEAVAQGWGRPMFEFPFDTTRAVSDLLLRGGIARHPRIRMVVPHGGGALAALGDRIGLFARIFVEGGDPDVAGQLRNLYYDLAGAPVPRQLPALLELTDPSHLPYGTDWPWTPEAAVTALPPG